MEALSVSLMGILTVFLILVMLAFAIILISKLLHALGLDKEEKPALAAASAGAGDEDASLHAAIIAAVSMEAGENSSVVSIKEI